MSDDHVLPEIQTITRTLTITTVETWTITIGGETSGPPEEQRATRYRAAQIDLSEQPEQESIHREET